jgi:hypothetical protein
MLPNVGMARLAGEVAQFESAVTTTINHKAVVDPDAPVPTQPRCLRHERGIGKATIRMEHTARRDLSVNQGFAVGNRIAYELTARLVVGYL